MGIEGLKTKSLAILGLSAYYHDSAAALVVDGRIVAAAQEERFTRKKFDARFPHHAIAYCLQAAGLTLNDLSEVVFYDKPLLKFDRLLETYLGYAPKGLRSFAAAMPVWLKEKLYLKSLLRSELSALGSRKKSDIPPLRFTEHHQAHAASAFFPSPFVRAAVICLDGVGEWATTSVWLGEDNRLTSQWEIDFPHSLGLLYSAFTYYTGFKVNSGEYKVMGLAPYGDPKYVDLILRELIDLKSDGTFRLNMYGGRSRAKLRRQRTNSAGRAVPPHLDSACRGRRRWCSGRRPCGLASVSRPAARVARRRRHAGSFLG